MRVHPSPRNVNITFRCGVNPAASAAAAAAAVRGWQKKLRRLPHIFSKVLELPFTADADVAVEEDAGSFRFVAAADGISADVHAHAIRIHPGVMKVVVRDDGSGGSGHEEDLELDRWRFRLPPTARPALASAAYTGGVLVVTIPKRAGAEEEDEGVEEFNDGFGAGDFGRLVIVQ